MPFQGHDRDEHFEALRSSTEGRTKKLTNYVPGSFNHTIIDGMYAGHEVERDHATLAMQLSGWIATAGGPVDEEQLLDIDPEYDTSWIDFDILNSYMDDEDLNAKVEEIGISRNPGYKATGHVTVHFTTTGNVIEPNTEFRTDPDDRGNFLSYYSTEQRTGDPDSSTVRVPIEAEEIGDTYNVGVGQVSNIGDGNVSGDRFVINNDPISGGEFEESNDELRKRAQNYITERSGGGTESGIRGRVEELLDRVEQKDIELIEHNNPGSNDDPDPGPYDGAPYGEVIIDAPEYTIPELQGAVDKAKPFGVGHPVYRPTIHNVDIDVTVVGSKGDIDISDLEIVLANHVGSLSLGENLYSGQIGFTLMSFDRDIIDTDTIRITEDGTDVGPDMIINRREKITPGMMNITIEDPPN